MKKIIAVCLSAAIVLCFCACGETAQMSSPAPTDSAEEEITKTVETAAETAVDAEEAQPSETAEEAAAAEVKASETAAEPETDESESNPAAEYVETVFEAVGEYTDFGGNKVEYSFSVPAITIKDERIEKINQGIYDQMVPPIEDALEIIDGKFSLMFTTVSYDAWLNGDILSIVTMTDYDNDFTDYHVWNVDIAEKRLLSNDELFSRLGMDKDGTRLSDATAACVGAYAAEKMPDLQLDFIREQYDNTIAPDNLAQAKYFIDGDGTLQCFVKIYSIAGAGYYYALVPITR